MEIGFSVRLPVDEHSVPFIRGMCRQALEHLGVDATTVHAITLALTEACANVVRHAREQQERPDYEVQVEIDDRRCRVSVVDTGAGFDPETVRDEDARPVVEGGRGLVLMRALVDTLDFVQDPRGRHRVTFEKSFAIAPSVTA